MEEKDFYEDVKPEDVENVLEKASAEKLPQSVKKAEETAAESVPAESKVEEPKTVEPEKQLKEEERHKEGNRGRNSDFLMRSFKKGDIISVTVVKVEPNGAYVSAGTKEDLFIPLKGLTNGQANSALDIVKVGDKIDVMVLRNSPNLVLSKRFADNTKKYEELQELAKKSEKVKAKVIKVTKGGLILDISGIQAFLPQSHIGLKKGETLDSFLGKEIDVEILEVDPKINRIIASRLKVLQEEKEELKKKTLVNLKKNEVYDGVVRSVQDFGAFVDIGNGVEGLVRISELTWGRRRDPHEVLKVGEKVKVKVIAVNLDTEKVLLSLRQAKPYPWDNVEEKYPIGSVVEGTVLRIHPFGVVLELDEGITGLVHISQLDTKRVNKIEDFVKIGDKMKVKVMQIDKENKKMKLSRRALLEEEKPEEDIEE
ncbi:MAG: S1 RNA-binding domain-containing protein [Candidatus Atribacteria bacterium]|nr:S1 RNA-binding domain-containing protein [Candidatus Atribacteria bacterium]